MKSPLFITACAAFAVAQVAAMTMSTMTGSTADIPYCVKSSMASNCTDYMYPAELIHRDITGNCDMMPYMTACTVRNLCKAGKAEGKYCQPFTLLASLCVDMPGMSPCKNYNSLCNTTSVVKQCKDMPDIPKMLTTKATFDTILSTCSDHSMPSCSQCKSSTACPDPLSTMANLCHEHPSMQQCASFYSFCAATNNELPLCTKASGDYSFLPSMKMYFHQRVGELILWRSWIPRSTGEYVGSIMAVMFFGIVSQLLKVVRLLLEARWQRSLKPSLCPCPPANKHAADGPLPVAALNKAWARCCMTTGQLRRSSIRSLFQGVTALLDYFNMLVVMTFNIGLCIAVVVGYMTGTLLFSHLLEERPAAVENADPLQFGGTAVTGSSTEKGQCCCSASKLEMGCGC